MIYLGVGPGGQGPLRLTFLCPAAAKHEHGESGAAHTTQREKREAMTVGCKSTTERQYNTTTYRRSQVVGNLLL